ncbi:MAG: MFS transporter [Candidatus Korobacteraceae bacterium]|jgi:EmrB/QacA subfamily drug resistance transporter
MGLVPAKIADNLHPKWWVLLAIGVGSLLGAVDASVVNLCLPVIRRELGSSVALIEWVVSIYLVVVCGLLLTFGRLGDLRGYKRLYLLGFVFFIMGSALCGLAWSVVVLIAFRGLQALGASILFACAPAILTGNFPASQRGQALGMQAFMIYFGQMAGPMLGGWLTDHFSWRAVFYINVPIGLAAVALSIYYIPRDQPNTQGEPFDLAGAALFMAGFVVLLLGLNQGYDRGWTSPSIVVLLAGAALLLFIFVLLERRRAHPLLDLKLFDDRVFSLSVASAVLNYISVYTVLFLLPFYLIQGRGLSPGQAGLLFTMQPAVMTFAAPISGTLSDRIGTRRLSMLGMAILGTGLFMLSRLHPDSSLVHVVSALGVCGLGTGTFIAPNNSALMGSAPRHRQGIASGVLATARYVGMILGVGISGAIFTTLLSRHTAMALFEGIRGGFLAASMAAFLGCLTSAVRKEVVVESTPGQAGVVAALAKGSEERI